MSSFLSFLFALLLPASALAQQATIVGRVVNDTAGAPVAGVLVRTDANTTVDTDENGRFVLTVPASGATIRITTTAAGFLEQTVDVPLVNQRAEVEITIHRNPEYHEEVEVAGRAAEVSVAPPSLVIDPLQVTRVAGAGDNVFRVLQTMPGVMATDDFGSRLSVRGGGPDQNLTVMDGVEIHNPYRLFGLTSAFNPETIERFELTAGGFSAKYGDRLSSILVVDNRSGTTRRSLAGSATMSITDANVIVEGRMPHGSWLVTGRRTYYDIFAERITDDDLPSFADLQAKFSYEPKPGHQFSFFALRSRESTDANFGGDSSGDNIGFIDHANNDLASMTYSALLGHQATLKTIVSFYKFNDDLGVDGTVRNDSSRSNGPTDDAFTRAAIVFDRGLEVQDASVREELTYAAGPRQTLNAGVEAHALKTTWGWEITGDRNTNAANGSSIQGGAGLPNLLNSSANTPRAGAWLEDDIKLTSRLRMAGGARIDYTSVSGETLLSPRLRATVDLTPATRLRLATGRFTQSPGYEKLLQADYFVDLSHSDALGLKNESSIHAIAGIEHDLGEGLHARVEGYWKSFEHVITGRLETPDETAARVAQYNFPANLASSVPTDTQITTVPSNDASGEAYGFDVYLEKQARSARQRLSGWVTYTWGRANVDNYGFTYPFDYDRRHALSVVSTLRVAKLMSLSSTLRVASGFPYTPAIGLRVASTPLQDTLAGTPGSLVPRYDSAGLPVWTVDYGGVSNLNSGQLPLYARLDLRFTYIKSASSRWQLYFEGINVLRRENAGQLNAHLEYDPSSDRPRLTVSREGGLPFFPSFGFRIRF